MEAIWQQALNRKIQKAIEQMMRSGEIDLWARNDGETLLSRNLHDPHHASQLH
jgi:hypothetical protein